MDPKRPSPPLPHGMNVTILYTASRGGYILGIDSSELVRLCGIAPGDYKRMSDWASFNDAHFYSGLEGSFSYDIAIADTVAMCLPRVVLHKIPKEESKPLQESTKPPALASKASKKSVVKKKTMAKKKSTTKRKSSDS